MFYNSSIAKVNLHFRVCFCNAHNPQLRYIILINSTFQLLHQIKFYGKKGVCTSFLAKNLAKNKNNGLRICLTPDFHRQTNGFKSINIKLINHLRSNY